MPVVAECAADIERHQETFRQRNARLDKPRIEPFRVLGEDWGSYIEGDAAGAEVARRRTACKLFQIATQVVPAEYPDQFDRMAWPMKVWSVKNINNRNMRKLST